MRGIRFRPEQSGLRATLFDLEADIMEAVWARKWEEFAVADVQQELQRQRNIAYTTVMTTVGRLHEKGLLDRVREGRRYVYRPLMSREQFSETMARELLGSLSGLGHRQALSLLVDQVRESDGEELEMLEVLIRRRKKELGE
ncbi:MAG: CopY family transcriptional regulator [Gemmatimonadetes bacterium]|nr:CopY family transcriptional regulator [Gemmatimonadota bacterium]